MINNDLVKSDTKLTIGMLVSNRIEYIEKALTALKPLLSEIPSELILVDTVGPENSDGSLEVAKRFTDKIYRFEWCNDFSKARNVAFEHAKGEWFMFQDDDEIFDDVTEIVDFFKSGQCENYMTGMYHILHYTGDGKTTKGVLQRMVRRKQNTRFEGRIHEHFNEANLPCKVFDAFVHHYGYLIAREEDVRAHQKRNIDLIREEIKENGLDARIAAQLVREMIFTAGTEDEGYEVLKDCISKLSESEMADPAGQWLLTASVRYFKNLGKNAEAEAEALRILNSEKLNESAKLILFWLLANLAAGREDVKETFKWVLEYDELLMVLLLDENLRLMQQTFDVDKFRSKEYRSVIYELGMISSFRLEKYAETIKFANKYYELNGNLDGKRFAPVIRRALGAPENRQELEKFMDRIYTEAGKRLVLK